MYQSIVIGHLGADAETGSANGKSYVRFRVASSRKYTDSKGVVHDETQWFSCIMSGDGGKLLPYLKRGQCVCVIGQTSLSIVSSPKLRRMVAAADINVANIELIGSPQDNSMPRQLATSDGLLHNVYKAYFVQADEIRPYITDDKYVPMYDNKGNAYEVTPEGWVVSVPSQSTNDSAAPAKGDEASAGGVSGAEAGTQVF